MFTVENLRRRWFTLEKLTKSIMNTIAGNYEDTFPAILPFIADRSYGGQTRIQRMGKFAVNRKDEVRR